MEGIGSGNHSPPVKYVICHTEYRPATLVQIAQFLRRVLGYCFKAQLGDRALNDPLFDRPASSEAESEYIVLLCSIKGYEISYLHRVPGSSRDTRTETQHLALPFIILPELLT